MRRPVLTCLLIAAAGLAAAPGRAQPVKPPPKNLSARDVEIWPFPPPDPRAWWDDKRPLPPEAADPLGRRRLGARERPIPVDNGIDPSTYRLWGLTPLQWQLPRGPEMVLEVWVRPSRSVRQSVARITVRRDGRAFVQGRAGLACCEAGIARRMGFDAELPPGEAPSFLALRADPLWEAPREVRVNEGPAVADSSCVDGVSYDLTLLIPGRSRTIHRACDEAEIGQAADVMSAVLRAALGHDPRFDLTVPSGGDLAAARAAYRNLLAQGGRLKPDPQARPQPPGVEPAPDTPDPTPPPPVDPAEPSPAPASGAPRPGGR